MKKIILASLIVALTGCAHTYLDQPEPLATARVKLEHTVITLKQYQGYYVTRVEPNLITGGDWPPVHIRKEKMIQAVRQHSGCEVTSVDFDPTAIADMTAVIDCSKK